MQIRLHILCQGLWNCQPPTLHSVITGIAFLEVLSQALFFPPWYILALFVSDSQICFSSPSLFSEFKIHICNGNSESLLEWLKDISNSIYPTELVTELFFPNKHLLEHCRSQWIAPCSQDLMSDFFFFFWCQNFKTTVGLQMPHAKSSPCQS